MNKRMEDIIIVIAEIPLPWKAPYVGSKGAFSPRYATTKILKQLIQDQYKGEILDIPLICDLTFYMPIPASTSKKKKQMMIDNEIRPTAGGDRTNLAKYAEDLLQGVVIKNDAKIVGGRVDKFFSDTPRTKITLSLASPRSELSDH